MEQYKRKEKQNNSIRSQRSQRTAQATARTQRAKTTISFAERIKEIPVSLKHKASHINKRTKTVMRESREKNFPESNRIFVQLFLLLCGLFSVCGSVIRENINKLRKHQFHLPQKGKRLIKWRAQKKYHPLIFVSAAVAIAAVSIFFSRYTFATTVIYDGQVQGIVESEGLAKRVAAQVETIATKTTGQSFSFTDNSIQYTHGLVARSELDDRDDLEAHLSDEVGLVTYGYSLYIDDELIGSTEYAGALESLLEQLKESYASADTLTIGFAEDVRIEEGYIPTDSIVNLGHIAELVNSTKSGEVTYTVVRGDTWGKIALEHDMTNAELEALNPGFNINKLQIGDELLLSNAVPYLTVVVTERQNYIEDIQYEIEYVDDSSMYRGDERVISQGVYGTADVVADVTYINGIEQTRTVLSSVTLSEPVTEQRAQGTKERPSWYPTGTFRWPTSGRITSYFGYRNTGIRGASTNHQGIDIAVPYGTSIYAADGGTVTFSGYKGAMGYVVIINHGNGYVTYYEHNSSLLVSAGQTVYKGQKIALAGASGVASGSHCHFGVQKNGVYVNPLNYLP